MSAPIEEMRKRLDALIETAPAGDQQDLFRKEMDGFFHIFQTFIEKKTTLIDWNKIKPPPESMVVPYSSLQEVNESTIKQLLEKTCVIKLNGGLGTTMGCTGPKSVIEVQKDLSFLDIAVLQVEALNRAYDVDVPLILMNSFNTDDDTRTLISKYTNLKIYTYNQSRHPRINKETLTPQPTNFKSDNGLWTPPGHGDVYEALFNCGLLKRLIDEGKEYCFLSNVDNLGAVVDTKILSHFASTEAEYIMEVTDKTRADVKGGTLIDYEGKAKLLELAQVPSSKVEEFKSIKKFKIFNTNNIWMKLSAVKRVIEEKTLDMDIIVNAKVSDGVQIIQLERAAGAAIQSFKHSMGINVDRSRFLPVKSTSDLFVIQSNVYRLDKSTYQMVMDNSRLTTFQGAAPLVKLGEEFKKVRDFGFRFKGIPDILELDHLTVSGDVTFGSQVSLKGTVIIVANHGARIDIPSGSVLENKVVSGNLRILDH